MNTGISSINDYIISYKGHGMTERATSSNSIGHVVNHENRHIQEFENYARFHNKEITNKDITINYRFVNGNIVAVSGKATAIMREKPTENAPPTIAANSDDSIATGDISVDQKTAENRKIDEALNKIETALSKIETRLAKSENNLAIDEYSYAGLARKTQSSDQALVSKKRELTAKLNNLKSEKLRHTTEQLLQMASELFEDAANIMKSIYGLKTGNENSQNSDEHNKVKVPDYSKQYTGLLLDTMI